MDMTRRAPPFLLISLLCALAGCAGHPAMPQPGGPLRVMNPGLWNYHGNDVMPQAQPQNAPS